MVNLFDSLSFLNYCERMNAVRYISLFLIYIGVRILAESQWVFSGEIYAETATNFFHTTRGNPSWGALLFTTDFGYIPLLQRILATFAYLTPMSALSIPYFYTWSAIIITPLIIGLFLHNSFRLVMPSDEMRYFVALLVLLSLDFETRTFLNFTYVVLFIFIALCALGLEAKENSDFPNWAWFLLPLIISKPYMLTLGPVFLFIFLRQKNRKIRLFFLASGLFLGIQLARLLVSMSQGTGKAVAHEGYTLIQKLIAAFGYVFIEMGQFALGPIVGKNVPDIATVIVYGVVGCVLVYFIWKKRATIPNMWVVWVGLAVIVFTSIINCVMLSMQWNMGFEKGARAIFYRHTINYFFAFIFIIATLIANWSQSINLNIFKKIKPTLRPICLLLIWFVCSGWLKAAYRGSFSPDFPALGSSNWQNQAGILDTDATSFIIPIDPHGWFYSETSELISEEPIPENSRLPLESGHSLSGNAPKRIDGRAISGIAMSVSPTEKMRSEKTTVTVKLKTRKGEQRFQGSRHVNRPTVIAIDFENPVNDIISWEVQTDNSLQVLSSNQNPNELGLFWFSNEK